MTDRPPSSGAALVTGAGRRLGLAIAGALAAEGAAEGAEAARGHGVRAVALAADLADPEAVATLAPRAAGALGRPLDLLVHNAAVFHRDSLQDATRAGWELHMAVNVTAPVFLTQAFVAQLPEGADGNVVNILDQRVVNPTPHRMSYSASKATLWALTRTWAVALAPRVRVNAIGPGMALPDHGSDETEMARRTEGYPLRRGTTPDEVNDALRYILGAPAMTGQILVLDGGQHLGWLHPPGGYPLP